jgi:hypothetical protein
MPPQSTAVIWPAQQQKMAALRLAGLHVTSLQKNTMQSIQTPKPEAMGLKSQQHDTPRV